MGWASWVWEDRGWESGGSEEGRERREQPRGNEEVICGIYGLFDPYTCSKFLECDVWNGIQVYIQTLPTFRSEEPEHWVC
jgi:hypothetical protein